MEPPPLAETLSKPVVIAREPSVLGPYLRFTDVLGKPPLDLVLEVASAVGFTTHEPSQSRRQRTNGSTRGHTSTMVRWSRAWNNSWRAR